MFVKTLKNLIRREFRQSQRLMHRPLHPPPFPFKFKGVGSSFSGPVRKSIIMSYLRGSLLAGASLSLVVMLLGAQNARAENLAGAIESALNHHPSVQAAFANREA